MSNIDFAKDPIQDQLWIKVIYVLSLKKPIFYKHWSVAKEAAIIWDKRRVAGRLFPVIWDKRRVAGRLFPDDVSHACLLLDILIQNWEQWLMTHRTSWMRWIAPCYIWGANTHEIQHGICGKVWHRGYHRDFHLGFVANFRHLNLL